MPGYGGADLPQGQYMASPDTLASDGAVQAEARAQLREATLPVHVAFADADPIFTWAWAEQWAAEIPGATLDRIEGAGHFVQIDAADDVLAVIRAHVGA